MGVVKADAYGHGAVEVSRILTAEGAEWLAVSSVPEGVALRRAGIQARILVMTGFLPFEWEALAELMAAAVSSAARLARRVLTRLCLWHWAALNPRRRRQRFKHKIILNPC